MAAGAVIAPFIIPLRPPLPGKSKLCIDNATKVEIKSDTPDTKVFFTLTGEKPDPRNKSSTLRYKAPITLPVGKQTIKAIAVTGDGRESNVVTKSFEVERSANDSSLKHTDRSLTEFLEDMPPESGDRPADEASRKAARDYIRKLLKDSSDAWTEDRPERQDRQTKPSSRASTSTSKADPYGDTSEKRKPTNDARYSSRYNETGSASMREPQASAFLESKAKPASAYFDSTSSGALPIDLRSGTKSDERFAPLNSSFSGTMAASLTSTQAFRASRQTDFLKCVYCQNPRPADPFARYCNACGNPVPPVPQARVLPPPEPGQMGTCVFCRSTVPFNLPLCVVCESPLSGQNQAQASIALRERRVCLVCSTTNPPYAQSCLTCEANLATNSRVVMANPLATVPPPPLPDQAGRLLRCTKCNRVNNSDARYCDWCGSKPTHNLHPISCSKCSASNHPYAKFCASCGSLVEAPTRIDPRNTGQLTAQKSDDGTWVPVQLPAETAVNLAPKVKTREAGVQTIGLHFPSSREMQRIQDEYDSKLRKLKDTRDRRPMLTAVSPGNGYWRKQIDHIVGHLRIYSQNTANFRASIGEPRIGKLLSAIVHEDGYELALSLVFELKNALALGTEADRFRSEEPLDIGKRTVSIGTAMRVDREVDDYRPPERSKSKSQAKRFEEESEDEGSQSELDRSEREKSEASAASGDDKQQKKKPKPTKTGKESASTKAKRAYEKKLSKQDRELLSEIGTNERNCDVDKIRRQFDEGGNPKLKDHEGLPLLFVAVRNRQSDAIPIIVQQGVDVNSKIPNRGNTPLHEAVRLGTSAMDVIDVLLGCGANYKLKNDKGETPYDVAVQLGHEDIAKKFASKIGESQLEKLTKPKMSGGDY